VLIDQPNLTFLDKFESKKKRHLKWQNIICSYNLEIEYGKEMLNKFEDGLLRPILEEMKEAKEIVNLAEPQIINSIDNLDDLSTVWKLHNSA
jgi:hypothetical protein